MLNMDFIPAIAGNHVPSTHEPDPYMHLFLDAGYGNVLAFFEWPTKPGMAAAFLSFRPRLFRFRTG